MVSFNIDPVFSRLLQRQREIQEGHMGGNPAAMPDDEKAAFIRNMSLALVAEVIEALDETRWKPWAKRNGQPVVKDKQLLTQELADVYIFLMNLMLAGGITSTELARAVDNKQGVNIQRQLNGYTSGNKCAACGRSYDDAGVGCTPVTDMKDRTDKLRPAWCGEYKRYLTVPGADYHTLPGVVAG